MTAGGTGSVIIILSPFHQGSQDIFCYNHQNYTGHEPIYRIKLQPSFTWEIRVFTHKQIQKKKYHQGSVKTTEKDFHIPGFIEKIGF
jgi:hypothetical protein